VKVSGVRRQGLGILVNVSEQESGFHLTLSQNIVEVDTSRSLGHWLSRLLLLTVCGAKNREWRPHPKGYHDVMFLRLQMKQCNIDNAISTCSRRITCGRLVRVFER
jgi:hypothetical protein